MTNTDDPTRLRLMAAPGSLLGEGLAGARDRGPSEAELRTLGASLFGGLAAGTNTSGRTSGQGSVPHVANGLTTAGVKLVATLAVAVVAAGAATLALHRGAVGTRERGPSRTPVAQVSSARSPAPVVEPIESPQPVGPRNDRRRSAPVSRPARGQTATPADQAGTAADAELQLIGKAQRSVLENPALALALVREHGRQFPNGLLGQESEAIAVSALQQLGRGDEARQRARKFVADHPDSTYLEQMRRLLDPKRSASP